VPAHDSASCVADFGDPGTCNLGICQPLPQCDVAPNTLTCGGSDLASTHNASSMLDTYSCATQETGPELGYPLSAATDGPMTITLTDLSADLDLIILRGTVCTGQADCVASSKTRGTGDEKVVLNAVAGEDYLVVVEGYDGAAGSFTLTVGCDNCKPIRDLDCNMTLVGDTSGAAATRYVSGFDCAPMTVGPEDTYHLAPRVTTDYKIKMSGLSQDLDLVVVWNQDGRCDPSTCKEGMPLSGTASEEVSFTGYDTSDYAVIVDSKGAGGPYQLEVTCTPTCGNTTAIDCSVGSDHRKNDDPVYSTNSVNAWQCDGDASGREVIYQFAPTQSGSYTFELTGLTADLDLIVGESDSSGCDPSQACMASANAGTADESITFNADSTKTYYVAVDGKAGAVSSYTLRLKSSACGAWTCNHEKRALSCFWPDDRGRNDDPASKLMVDTWSTCDSGTTGPEVVYSFKAPADGSYTFTLDELDADLDLIGMAPSCNVLTGVCMASPKTGTDAESITFDIPKDVTVWIAVDGKAGATGSYHIRASSPACGAAQCQDANDDLSCDVRRTNGQTDGPGASHVVASWGPTGTPCDTGTPGPERAHHFSPDGPGPFTVRLSGQTADLDLIVLEAGTACDPGAACLGASANGGTADEAVTFTADPAKTYWLIVDSKTETPSPYTLTVARGCP
jgi:hypothetical protein